MDKPPASYFIIYIYLIFITSRFILLRQAIFVKLWYNENYKFIPGIFKYGRPAVYDQYS